MIFNDRITDYIRSLESSQGSLLDSIEQEAERERVPIIRRETAALLRTLVAALRPARILEIGTAVGYSSLLMCRVMPENCRITTIEKYEKRIPAAREHFKIAGEEGRITLLEGDADDLLAGLKGQTFDLVFMDAAKGQYLHWLPMILALMPEGGVVISDNVLQDGDIVESRFAVERRNRTIHSRMRRYLYELKHRKGLETAIIPIGDGVAGTLYRNFLTDSHPPPHLLLCRKPFNQITSFRRILAILSSSSPRITFHASTACSLPAASAFTASFLSFTVICIPIYLHTPLSNNFFWVLSFYHGVPGNTIYKKGEIL